MSMITVEGSSAGNNGIIFNKPEVTYQDDATTSQIDVIKAFMASLDTSTTSSATTMLDNAVKACSTFSGIGDAINHFLYDASIYDASTFLTERCGIILGNDDTGAITGSDAGTTTTDKTASSVVLESGSIDTSFLGTSFTSNGLTLTLGTSYKSTDDAHKTIWQALRSWWADAALKLISESYGSNFGFGTSAAVTNMTVQFTTATSGSNSNALAWVGYTYNTGNGAAASLSLTVNMKYYGSISSSTIDGDGKSSTSGSLYLDRVLAHEFTHAVMATNINWFDNLPLFIVEGMAELTHGIDDARYSSITHLASNYTDLSKAVSLTAKSYTSDYAYAGGYMFLRYLAKQANSSDNSVVYGTEKDDNGSKKGNAIITNEAALKLIYALAGNDKVVNSGNNVTIVGGTGNDTINLNGSNQTVVYSSGDGKDVITGFGVSDSISITAGEITTSALKKDNVVLTIGKGNITLNDAKDQFIKIIDADGKLSTRMYGKGTITVQGSSDSETLTAWAKADSLNGGEGNDTLIGGKGADTLTGGSGADKFYYTLGDGADVITDYTANEDVIVLDDTTVTKVAQVRKSESDLLFTVKKGSIRVNNGAGNRITFRDTSGNIILNQTFGSPYIYISNGDYSTVNTAIDASVITLDSSYRTSDVMLIGNAQSNYIRLGSGNETVTTGKGKDTVEYLGGNVVITDYTAGSDVIKLTNSDIVSAKLDSGNNSVVFTLKDTGTTTTSTLTLQNMVKKKAVQKVTVIDKDGISYSQVFGSPTLTIANTDGDTVIANSDVTVMNASKRSKSVYLVGNEFANTIRGGSKADTIEAGLGNDSITGGKGDDIFIFSGGKDTIADYSVAKNNTDLPWLRVLAGKTNWSDMTAADYHSSARIRYQFDNPQWQG